MYRYIHMCVLRVTPMHTHTHTHTHYEPSNKGETMQPVDYGYVVNSAAAPNSSSGRLGLQPHMPSCAAHLDILQGLSR